MLSAGAWDEALGAFDFHRIAPLLCWQIASSAATPRPPDRVMESLHEAFGNSHVRLLQAGRQLAAVSAALCERDVEFIVLKGPAFAWSVYPHPAARPFGDLDLLVRVPDVDQAHSILTRLGYRSPNRDSSVALFREVYHHDDYLPGRELANCLMVELHWGLRRFPSVGAGQGTAGLFERAVTVSAPGVAFSALHPVDALIHAAMHQQLTHRNEPWLIWTCDIAYLARRFGVGDWPVLQKRIADRATFDAVCKSLQTASEWTGLRLPEAYQDFSLWPVPKETPESIFIRNYPHGWLTGLMRVGRSRRGVPAAPRLVDLFHFWWRMVFPKPSAMALNYRPAHPWLLPWTYVQRWAKWLSFLFRSPS
jgi:hypothetical protein